MAVLATLMPCASARALSAPPKQLPSHKSEPRAEEFRKTRGRGPRASRVPGSGATLPAPKPAWRLGVRASAVAVPSPARLASLLRRGRLGRAPPAPLGLTAKRPLTRAIRDASPWLEPTTPRDGLP